MSLSEEDRNALVSLEQEKAHTFLEQTFPLTPAPRIRV